MHGIAVDTKHDEIIVPNPLASSILVFRGHAAGNESPLRVIQGPRTGLIRPHSVDLDLVHDEILVSDPRSGAVFTFARAAHGDVAPLRVIRGPKTNLFEIVGVAVDPVRNLLVVANGRSSRGEGALYIFNRTDDGNVAPLRSIKGPATGLVRPFGVVLHNDQIVVAVRRGDYIIPYRTGQPKPLEEIRALIERSTMKPRRVSQDPTIVSIPSPWDSLELGFIGVWDINDDGDVPPRLIVRGPATRLIQPAALALAPLHKEMFVTDSPSNSVYTFLVPEIFRHPPQKSAAGR